MALQISCGKGLPELIYELRIMPLGLPRELANMVIEAEGKRDLTEGFFSLLGNIWLSQSHCGSPTSHEMVPFP